MASERFGVGRAGTVQRTFLSFSHKSNGRCHLGRCNCTNGPGSSARRREAVLSTGALLAATLLSQPHNAAAVEQGILASDYTVPALSSKEYVEKIANLRGQAWSGLRELAEAGKYTELSNSLVLSPVDDIRQSVLYVPSALLKEGRRQEAVASRKAYTDFLRELKKLDEVAQKAARYDADDEDVTETIERLSKRLDAVLKTVG